MQSRQTAQSINYEIGKTFELDLANIIKGIAFHEISIENAKIKAAENPHFNVFASWESIDPLHQSCISKQHLITFLAKNGTPCSDLEALYLVNMISRGKNFINENEMVAWFLPYTNYNLKMLALKRRENTQSHRRIQAVDTVIMREASEQLAASILTSELNFNYDIENLKKQFLKDHSHNIHDICSHIVFSDAGYVDFKRLSEFMRRLGILFSEEECKGFFHRSSSTLDESDESYEISYEELIEMIMPMSPAGIKAYRDTFEKDALREYVIKKAKDFEFDINPPSFGMKNVSEEFAQKQFQQKNIMQHYQPFRQIFDPFQKGKMTFSRDVGYLSEMESYTGLYCNPCQNTGTRLKNSSKNGGIRYHDNYFDQYYELLYKREKNEVYFNKLGKRYAQDANSIAVSSPAQQSMIRKIRANSTYGNSSSAAAVKTMGDAPAFNVATQRISQPQNYSAAAGASQTEYEFKADSKSTATNKFYQPSSQLNQQQQYQPSSSVASSSYQFNSNNTIKFAQQQERQDSNAFDEDDF